MGFLRFQDSNVRKLMKVVPPNCYFHFFTTLFAIWEICENVVSLKRICCSHLRRSLRLSTTSQSANRWVPTVLTDGTPWPRSSTMPIWSAPWMDGWTLGIRKVGAFSTVSRNRFRPYWTKAWRTRSANSWMRLKRRRARNSIILSATETVMSHRPRSFFIFLVLLLQGIHMPIPYNLIRLVLRKKTKRLDKKPLNGWVGSHGEEKHELLPSPH